MPHVKRYTALYMTGLFIIAGAVGNMIDRALHQYVIDFFYFKLIDFPIFNVADIYVTVSTILILLLILFYYKEEELDDLFAVITRKKDSLTHE